jgi:hypothetical protein
MLRSKPLSVGYNKIMHEGAIDFLSIEGNIFRILQKVDDANEFRIGTFAIPD